MSGTNGTVAVPATMYRFIVGLISLLMVGVVGASGWSLLTLNEMSVDMSAIKARMASAEAKIDADSTDKDNDIRKVQADVERIGTRLETKIDNLTNAILNSKTKSDP